MSEEYLIERLGALTVARVKLQAGKPHLGCRKGGCALRTNLHRRATLGEECYEDRIAGKVDRKVE